MVTETTKFNPYNIVDYGLQIFLCILFAMVLIWCIFQIVKYCKIIKANFTATKSQQTEFDELADIKNRVNATLTRLQSDRDDL